jgi:hypothetical protein
LNDGRVLSHHCCSIPEVSSRSSETVIENFPLIRIVISLCVAAVLSEHLYKFIHNQAPQQGW